MPGSAPIRRIAAGTHTSRKYFVRIGCSLASSEPGMKFLGYAYRFASNFVFLALVYYSLNLIEKYPQRAMLALLILVYSVMHSISALRSFFFFQRIERLEGEARRLGTIAAEGPSATAARKQIVGDVAELRHAGEMKAYIDLLFLALVILLCIAKIVTN
jgi:hypothetical protein